MVRVCVLGLSLLLASSTAFAQVSATTGSINGKVTDSSGGVLPGVTITASSPSMQGVRTDVTNENGEYRFPAVPPGTYKLVYELVGFGTVNREGVNVGLGFTATVNIELNVASLQETVTVSGESPVVDVSTTTTASNFGEERLAALPNARDFWTVLAASPAIVVTRIDVGGSAAGTQTGYAAYDTKEDQHRPMVEGIVNTEGTNGAGFYYDYGSIDEVAVQTKGHTAEMPWPGVWSNFIAKSGGNQFHGKMYGDYQNKGIQRENIPDSLITLCPSTTRNGVAVRDCGSLTPSDLNRMVRYYDVNADAGGYVPGLQDKLWWYASARDQNIRTQVPNFPVKAFETGLRNLTGKLTYALSQNNKLTAFAQGGQKRQPNRLDTFQIAATVARHSSEDSTWEQRYWGHTYKAGYESVLGDNSFFEMRAGQFKYEWPNFRYSEAPAYQDRGTNEVRGGNRDGWYNIPSRNQIAGSVTYFKDGLAGSHNFKVGGEWFRETFTYLRGANGVDGVIPGDVLHMLNNGAPAEVYLFQTPSRSEQGLRTTGFYVQDTWRMSSRITLNVGLRFDQYKSFLPEQEGPTGGRFAPATATKYAEVGDVKTFNHPVPRIGLIYDVTGAGRTVIKANYAQYYWNPGTDIANNVNPNSQDYFRRYAWDDGLRFAAGTPGRLNNVYDAGEEGALIQSAGGVGSATLDPNLKNTRTDEVSAWVEHELVPGIGLQAGYVYRKIDDFRVSINVNRPFSAYNVPVTLRDPGPDGAFGNADDGPNFQAMNLSAAALAAPVVNQLTNLDGNGQYQTVEFSANKRQTGRYSLAAAFAKRWNKDHSTAYFSQTLRAVTTPSTPNDLINTDDGRFNFSMWTAKVNGSYEAPWKIRLTPALRFQSGQPYGRKIAATAAYGIGGTGGINYGTANILVEKMGARKQDDILILDFRAEKYFDIGSQGSNRRIGVFFDVYNLTNSDAYQNINWTSGSTFELPTAIVPPTIARFGMKFDW